MRTSKQDRRHTGHDMYKYAATFRYAEADKFVEVRNWCWATWGPSCELEFMHKMPKLLPWCWISDNYRTRILFETEKEYNWFCLKWKK